MKNTTHGKEAPEFTLGEFENRVECALRLMTAEKLDGMLFTSEPNLEYLSGFTTQFAWNTPTRPWYFVLTRDGKATGVIPEIGITNWHATSWAEDIRTWPSPRPENEGLDLLGDVIAGINREYGRFGVELGPETRIGMPVSDLLRLQEAMRPFEMADCSGVMRELRLVKSPAEVGRIQHICRIAGEAFDAIPELITPGDTEKNLVRKFSADILLRGGDKTPYTSIGSGPGGYDSIIMAPTDRLLEAGDIFMIDTGSRYGGYFCDFDRNFSIGEPSGEAKRTYDLLYRATEAGIEAARPGNTAADVFDAQARVFAQAGIEAGNVGRLGHGLGKIMTEPPSIKPNDDTRLVPGVVLTIEPSAMFGNGKIMAHEEDLVVTEDACRLLTPRAARELPVIDDTPFR